MVVRGATWEFLPIGPQQTPETPLLSNTAQPVDSVLVLSFHFFNLQQSFIFLIFFLLREYLLICCCFITRPVCGANTVVLFKTEPIVVSFIAWFSWSAFIV